MPLQNDSACQLFWSTTILTILSKKMIKPVHSWSYKKYFKKTPEPFCRASILSRTQRRLPFSQSHFVGFSPSSSSSLILFGGGTNLFRVCDEHQAREGQHGGILGRRGNLNVRKRLLSQPLLTQILYTYKMVHVLKRWVLYGMATWCFFVNG